LDVAKLDNFFARVCVGAVATIRGGLIRPGDCVRCRLRLRVGVSPVRDLRYPGFDRPAAGRSFFEQPIRDHLDAGRPEKVSLIFDRRISRRTPGHLPHPGDHQRRGPADQLLLQVEPASEARSRHTLLLAKTLTDRRLGEQRPPNKRSTTVGSPFDSH
jgi:hypothetical protein